MPFWESDFAFPGSLPELQELLWKAPPEFSESSELQNGLLTLSFFPAQTGSWIGFWFIGRFPDFVFMDSLILKHPLEAAHWENANAGS